MPRDRVTEARKAMGRRAHRVGRVDVRGDSVLLEPGSIGRGERIPEELRDGAGQARGRRRKAVP